MPSAEEEPHLNQGEYRNVPVFQEGIGFNLARITGRADVSIDEGRKEAVITVTTTEGSLFYDFLMTGRLRTLSLGGYIDQIDRESEAYKNYQEKNGALPRD